MNDYTYPSRNDSTKPEILVQDLSMGRQRFQAEGKAWEQVYRSRRWHERFQLLLKCLASRAPLPSCIHQK